MNLICEREKPIVEFKFVIAKGRNDYAVLYSQKINIICSNIVDYKKYRSVKI